MTDIEQALEDFRFWLAKDIDFAISDEPVTTCLTIARARICQLEKYILYQAFGFDFEDEEYEY
jgi:hypothetical protein